MKIFIVGILVGVVASVAAFKILLLPEIEHGGNHFEVGYGAAVDEIISKIESEFEEANKVTSDTQVLFSNKNKTVLIKERNGVKTLELHGN